MSGEGAGILFLLEARFVPGEDVIEDTIGIRGRADAAGLLVEGEGGEEVLWVGVVVADAFFGLLVAEGGREVDLSFFEHGEDLRDGGGGGINTL